MTATCTLCGTQIVGKEDPVIDPLRNRRLLTYLAVETMMHMQFRHADDEQTVVDRSEFPQQRADGSMCPNTIATLVEAANANAALLTALSFVQSEDPAFDPERGKMKDLVMKSIAPKAVRPAVVV